MTIVKIMNYSVWKLIFGRGGILPGPWRMGRALVKREHGGEHYRLMHRARTKWKLQCMIWRKLNFWERTENTIDQVDRGQFARYILFTRRYWSVTNCCSHANKNSNVISFPVWLKCPISEAVISNIRCMAFLLALQCNVLVQKEKMKKKVFVLCKHEGHLPSLDQVLWWPQYSSLMHHNYCRSPKYVCSINTPLTKRLRK